MLRRVLTAALLCSSSVVLATPSVSLADAPPAFWPNCSSSADVECVESLRYTTDSSTVEVASPGAAADGSSEPYVSVMTNTMQGPSGATTMVNFTVNNPLDPVLGPGVYGGLVEGTYTFTLRLGAMDPSFTGLSADVVSVVPATRADGSFALSITARPKPLVSVMSTFSACMADGWACQGEVGVQRNISGFATTHPIAQLRPVMRGTWIATNASSFSSPQFSLAERKMTTSAAGPHTVPDGYPTAGLTMENGRGLNPAFYKAFVPFSLLQAMLDQAPEQLREFVTPETVRAKVSEMGSQKDQAVSITLADTGVVIDLGLTHFSAPNPEITFLKAQKPVSSTPTTGSPSVGSPSTGAPSVGSPTGTSPTTDTTSPKSTPAKVSRGKTFTPASYVKVPTGYRVVSVAVKSSSKKVCSTSGTKISAKKSGKCIYTVVVQRGKTRKTLTGTTTIS